ncbi:MAG: 1-deoxy-D-xylulose-5-phosphate reductoisomerase [Actinobacteria bacterium]|nr:1-deoxy-D-xylulose-5-phosphate reductoisomerase [Actinomycetota bacterium]
MGETGAVSRRDIVILGSTGSIGVQALDVIRRNPGDFRVVGLAAGGSNLELLCAQVLEFGVPHVAVGRNDCFDRLVGLLSGVGAHVTGGQDAVADLAALPCDVVLNGMAGSAGLVPTLRALEAGSTVALANKESLIIGGPLVNALARPGQIVPVDSEHSALAQCLRGGRASEVRRLILTASGGPFRGRTRAELAEVTPAQALAHPTWSMGPLVTINSATLMNKGLELIEAHLLFGVPLDRIDVVVHPQSVVHSMVEFIDGSTLAQASPPDMRLPIALGLAWPDRIADAAPGCDWTSGARWDFEPLDEDVFPAVRLARRAAAAGGTAPAVMNGADEVCVEAFLSGRLAFLGIVDTVSKVLEEHLSASRDGGGNEITLSDVITADAWARARAEALTGQPREGGTT